MLSVVSVPGVNPQSVSYQATLTCGMMLGATDIASEFGVAIFGEQKCHRAA